MEVIEKLLDRIIEKSPVAGAILVGLWGCYAIYRGLRDKVIAIAEGTRGDSPQAESNDRLHAQLENEQLRRELEKVLTAMREALLEAAKRDRHEMYNRMHVIVTQFEGGLDRFETSFRDMCTKYDDRIRALELSDASRQRQRARSRRPMKPK